jgi:hypothetical protein
MQHSVPVSMSQGMELKVEMVVSALQQARPFIEDQSIIDETIASAGELKNESPSLKITFLKKAASVLAALTLKTVVQQLAPNVANELVDIVNRIVEFVRSLSE